MKYILIILSLLFISCERYSTSFSDVNGYIKSKDSVPAYSKFEYHYVWSMLKGKFCWYWGNNHHSAKYSTSISVEGKQIDFESKEIFYYKTNDSIKMLKKVNIRDKDSTVINTTYYIK